MLYHLIKFLAPNLRLIEDKAFNGDLYLEKVEIGDKIKMLGIDCFLHCENLYDFKLPSQLEIIRAGCFSHCKSMKNFDFPETLRMVEKLAFADTDIETAIFPKNMETIGEAIFFNCKNLKEIQMSKNTQKHKQAFSLEQELLIELYESPKTKIKKFLKNMER